MLSYRCLGFTQGDIKQISLIFVRSITMYTSQRKHTHWHHAPFILFAWQVKWYRICMCVLNWQLTLSHKWIHWFTEYFLSHFPTLCDKRTGMHNACNRTTWRSPVACLIYHDCLLSVFFISCVTCKTALSPVLFVSFPSSSTSFQIFPYLVP